MSGKDYRTMLYTVRPKFEKPQLLPGRLQGSASLLKVDNSFAEC